MEDLERRFVLTDEPAEDDGMRVSVAGKRFRRCVFYHSTAISFLQEKPCGYTFEPEEDAAAPLEGTKTPPILFKQINIQFVYEFVIIDLVIEYSSNDGI